jgi:hypothetical protein
MALMALTFHFVGADLGSALQTLFMHPPLDGWRSFAKALTGPRTVEPSSPHERRAWNGAAAYAALSAAARSQAKLARGDAKSAVSDPAGSFNASQKPVSDREHCGRETRGIGSDASALGPAAYLLGTNLPVGGGVPHRAISPIA